MKSHAAQQQAAQQMINKRDDLTTDLNADLNADLTSDPMAQGHPYQDQLVGSDDEEVEEEDDDVGGQALFECEVCEASFWNQEQLTEHLLNSGHQNKQVSTVNVSQMAAE